MSTPYSSFDDLKTAILEKIAQAEVCDAYYEALISIDFLSLIAAGCGYYRWLAAAILNDDMIDTFAESDLNQYGIYRLDATLTDPLQDDYLGCQDNYSIITENAPDFECGVTLWFVRESNFTVNLDGNNIATIYAMGDSVGTINLTNNAKANIFAVQNSNVTVNLSNNSSSCITSNDHAQATVTANDSSVVNGWIRGNSTLTYTGNNSSSSTIKVYGKTVTNYISDIGTYFKAYPFSKDAQLINALP